MFLSLLFQNSFETQVSWISERETPSGKQQDKERWLWKTAGEKGTGGGEDVRVLPCKESTQKYHKMHPTTWSISPDRHSFDYKHILCRVHFLMLITELWVRLCNCNTVRVSERLMTMNETKSWNHKTKTFHNGGEADLMRSRLWIDPNICEPQIKCIYRNQLILTFNNHR